MGIAYRSTLGEPPTGNAVVSDVLYGKTFSNADGTDKVGTMPNNGAVAPTALDPGGSYTIPAGYHNGQGAVSAKSNTATYTASSRGAALDMGAANLNRYVNTNGVPNSNSGTYTFPTNDTGGTKDLGATNSYRYVNAQNVYNKGKADGAASSNMIITANPSDVVIMDKTKAKAISAYFTNTDVSLAKVQRSYDGIQQHLTITPSQNVKITYATNFAAGGTAVTVGSDLVNANTSKTYNFANSNDFSAIIELV